MRHWVVLAAAALLAHGAGRAAECGAQLDARGRRQIDSGTHRLAFAPRPGPLAVGRHFGLDVVVCPREGSSQPVSLRVDAEMPQHRHGMNYLPTVQRLGDGRYRVEGMMFHMPGRWRLNFDLAADGRLQRLSQEFDVE